MVRLIGAPAVAFGLGKHCLIWGILKVAVTGLGGEGSVGMRERDQDSPAWLGVESWHYNLKGRWFEGGEGVGSRKKSVEREPLPLSCVNLVQILVQITSRSWIQESDSHEVGFCYFCTFESQCLRTSLAAQTCPFSAEGWVPFLVSLCPVTLSLGNACVE